MKPTKQKSYQGGQAVLIMVMFLTLVSLTLVGQASVPARADLALAKNLLESKSSFLVSESGLEDLSFRVRKAWDYDAVEMLSLNGHTATTTVSTDVTSGSKTVVASSSVRNLLRSQSNSLSKNTKVSFNYGVQAGNGGFIMANSSSVRGNIYANGSITGSGNMVYGSIVSAGPDGYIEDLHATSSAFAHTIKDSTIDKDAYYFAANTLINTTVSGVKYPGSVDKATTSFPISDAQIEQWKADAEAGGVHTSPCPYVIQTAVTLGPIKINCNLELSNSGSLTLAGMVWVNGNFTIKNNSGISLHPALGARSVSLIVDNPDNRSTGSLVDLQNSTTFFDSGTDGSFLFLISANNSAENGGDVTAIDLKNSASGEVILYSNHGKIVIGNSSTLKSVTGYLISMKNSAQLIYDDGLESSLFDTGPGGSWAVDSWREVE